jgi:deoxycytidylate deaminase
MDLNYNRCAKQITIAIIENKGSYWIGTNWCRKPQKKCPRKGMLSGEGYELCRTICDQSGHAEENALSAAGKKASGGTLYLIGHTYCCSNCKNQLRDAGIEKINIVMH